MARASTPKLDDHRPEKRRRFRFSVWTIVAPVALAACVLVIVSIARQAGWTDRGDDAPGARTATGATATQPGAAILYRARRGETMVDVAVRFGISVERLRVLNPALPASGDLPAGRRVRLR
jgi:hypothetical protein